MKIYTKTGDDGTTGLFAGGRVSKHDPRISAYGTVDELNAILGVVEATLRESATHADGKADTSLLLDLSRDLIRLQHDLFSVGAELASPDPEKNGTKLISQRDILRLEERIDALETRLEPLTFFILPGGSRSAAELHWARTVCRRAERDVVSLATDPTVADCTTVVTYLNRLSDLLFVMARAANSALRISDTRWEKPE